MMLSRLNPFRGLPNKREVWAWGMFDLANQSFTLLINTLLFAIFFKEVVVADDARDDKLWGITVAISLALVVAVSPIAGAIADFKAIKKPVLLVLGALCVTFTCGLALIPNDLTGTTLALILAMGLYIPANFAYQLGENFLASFLPEVASRQRMGRVSGLGWSMGYVGALILLGLTSLLMSVFDLGPVERWRPLFVFAGVWFLLMAIPTALFLKERAVPMPLPSGQTIVTIGFHRFAETVRHASRFRQLARFLLAFLIYGFGVQVVIFFSAPIAKEFGFTDQKLVLFMLQLTIVAGIAAIATSTFQDRIGHRRTVLLFLIVWTLNAAGLAVLARYKAIQGDQPVPQWPVWMIGNGIGLGLGGIGTASRAMVGAFTPIHRTAEFFGLWGLTYKLAGCIGVLSFGLMKDALGTVAALVLLASFFIVGFVLLLSVNQEQGIRTADEAEREHFRERDIQDEAAAVSSGVMGIPGLQAPHVAPQDGDD